MIANLRLSFFVGLAFIFVSCHSSPLRTPSAKPQESDSHWLKDYKEAKSAPADQATKACEKFKDLARDQKFPAHDVAQLRAVEVCPADQFISYDRGTIPTWLQTQAVDVLLKKAGERADPTAEMELAVEKSKFKLPQAEKVKWMTLAIQRAEELNLPDKQNEFKLRLYGIAPRLNPSPTERQYLAVAGDWRFARQFEKAREYYEKIIASETAASDDKILAFKGLRQAYKNARQNDNHLAVAQRLIDFLKRAAKKNPRVRGLLASWYDARVYRARAQWTLGQSSEAKKQFDAIEKEFKGKVSLGELYWLKGRMAEESKDYTTVAKYMALALKERFNDTDMRDKVLWNSAWNERRRGDLPAAIEILTTMDQKTLVEFTRQRALYWLGKTYLESDQGELARTTFDRLIDSDPLGYYGLLAHRERGLPITLPTPAQVSEVSLVSSEAAPPLDTTLAQWLFQLEEKDILTAYLDEASLKYQRQKSQNDEGWVTIFKFYAKAGLYMKLYESLGALTPDQRKTIFVHHPELVFPQPWQELVVGAATQFGVDPGLIYAIIRQESAFDPHARSGADAFGLMQLIPEVAENLKDKYKIPYTGMEDLYDPQTNLRFGAAHLKELFKRYHGQFIPAVASYNASEAVIRTWLKTRFRGNAIEFIEDIPYEETRAYVRLVMRNLIFYDLLASKSPEIAFPEWVLKLEGAEAL